MPPKCDNCGKEGSEDMVHKCHICGHIRCSENCHLVLMSKDRLSDEALSKWPDQVMASLERGNR